MIQQRQIAPILFAARTPEPTTVVHFGREFFCECSPGFRFHSTGVAGNSPPVAIRQPVPFHAVRNPEPAWPCGWPFRPKCRTDLEDQLAGSQTEASARLNGMQAQLQRSVRELNLIPYQHRTHRITSVSVVEFEPTSGPYKQCPASGLRRILQWSYRGQKDRKSFFCHTFFCLECLSFESVLSKLS